jgi:hypothetical protein
MYWHAITGAVVESAVVAVAAILAMPFFFALSLPFGW